MKEPGITIDYWTGPRDANGKPLPREDHKARDGSDDYWIAVAAWARANKICPTCRKRKAKKGKVGCSKCIRRAGDRRLRWRADEMCVDCRTPSKSRRCSACNKINKDKARIRICPLSKRQRQVIGLVARGMTNAAIAAKLEIAIGTVTVHITAAMHKLGAEDRFDAVVRMRQADSVRNR